MTRITLTLTLTLLALGLTACSSDPGGLPLPDAGVPLAVTCASDQDCNDGVDCTNEVCQAETKTCLRVPNDGMCPAGQTCQLGANVGEGGCQAPTPPDPTCPVDCDDHVSCTIDTCSASDLMCKHLPDTSKCDIGNVCDPVKGCIAPTPPPMCPPSCDDGVACTVDSCGADLTCKHLPDSSKCPVGQTCSATGCVAPPPPSRTVACAVNGSAMTITITGPIQDSLVGGTVVNPGALEIVGDWDSSWGLIPYASATTDHPMVAYAADDGTYTMSVSSAVNGFNLFLANATHDGGRWFDLVDVDANGHKFAVTGACSLSGTKIVH